MGKLLNSQKYDGIGRLVTWYGGVMQVKALGSFDGAKVKLQYSRNINNWFDIKDAIFTDDKDIYVHISPGFVRAVVEGAGEKTKLDMVY